MKEIKIHKAQGINGDEVESVKIEIYEEFPDNSRQGLDYLTEGLKLHEKNACELERTLYKVLPGGTYDQLLGFMLKRKSSHFIVSYNKED